MTKFAHQFVVSKASEEFDEVRSWNEYLRDFRTIQSLIWLLQERIDLTSIVDLTTRTPRIISEEITSSLPKPLYILSSPCTTILTDIQTTYVNIPPHVRFSKCTSDWKWFTYNDGNNLHHSTSNNNGSARVEEIIPLSVPNTKIQWLDPEWHATLLELIIEYNGGEYTRAIIVLHCAHVDAAKIFDTATPTAVILNGLTEQSDTHPYRKDGPIINAITKLNPRFVGIDTPEFINDRPHVPGEVDWYTIDQGSWMRVSQ